MKKKRNTTHFYIQQLNIFALWKIIENFVLVFGFCSSSPLFSCICVCVGCDESLGLYSCIITILRANCRRVCVCRHRITAT